LALQKQERINWLAGLLFQPGIPGPKSSPKRSAVKVKTKPAKLTARVTARSEGWLVARIKPYTIALMEILSKVDEQLKT
jgi:hypothetical protein